MSAGSFSRTAAGNRAYAIQEELENSCGSFMGYRQLTRRLRRKYDLKVRRDTVMREPSAS